MFINHEFCYKLKGNHNIDSHLKMLPNYKDKGIKRFHEVVDQ